MKKFSHIALGVFLGSFIITAVLYLCGNHQKRYVYYFNSWGTTKLCTEVRRSMQKPEQGKVEYFIQDLLLGPMTYRYKSVFPLGTKMDFCIKKKKELHVGLSSEALKNYSDQAELRKNIAVFKKNIVKNFANFNKIYIYIGGELVE